MAVRQKEMERLFDKATEWTNLMMRTVHEEQLVPGFKYAHDDILYIDKNKLAKIKELTLQNGIYICIIFSNLYNAGIHALLLVCVEEEHYVIDPNQQESGYNFRTIKGIELDYTESCSTKQTAAATPEQAGDRYPLIGWLSKQFSDTWNYICSMYNPKVDLSKYVPSHQDQKLAKLSPVPCLKKSASLPAAADLERYKKYSKSLKGDSITINDTIYSRMNGALDAHGEGICAPVISMMKYPLEEGLKSVVKPLQNVTSLKRKLEESKVNRHQKKAKKEAAEAVEAAEAGAAKSTKWLETIQNIIFKFLTSKIKGVEGHKDPNTEDNPLRTPKDFFSNDDKFILPQHMLQILRPEQALKAAFLYTSQGAFRSQTMGGGGKRKTKRKKKQKRKKRKTRKTRTRRYKSRRNKKRR